MAAMHETWLRASLVIAAGVALSWLLGWALDKPFPKSRVRDTILTGACIYAALALDSFFLK